MSKKSHKKTNPRRIPATAADVKKAAKSGVEEAVSATQAIFFTVLRSCGFLAGGQGFVRGNYRRICLY